MITFSLMINTHCGLSGTEELAQGLRDLRRNFEQHPSFRGWYEFDASQTDRSPEELIHGVISDQIILVLNPALIVCNHLVESLQAVLRKFPESIVVPADPRTAHGKWQIDYASRAGFDSYADKRAALPQTVAASSNAPWLLMANRASLQTFWLKKPMQTWVDTFFHWVQPRLEAQHAFVHSYADYQCNDRQEMLDMIPLGVQRLMDVGGGEGRFLTVFRMARGGETLLVEPNPSSATTAQKIGISVLNARFESVKEDQVGLFDCISFLDVLEHMVDPLEALLHASTLLKQGGYVLMSVPNMGHWSVVQDLLQGRFDYLPVGILCCTHLRFFTETTLRQLLHDANLKVATWRNQASPMPAAFSMFLKDRAIDQIPINLQSMNTDSFHVLAVKP